MAEKKDTENKAFIWKVIGAAAFGVGLLLSASVAALGGKADIALPGKSKKEMSDNED